MDRRCGTVAVVGAPNAGKSTLLNALVGQKVAIVSPKIQTTRGQILAVGLSGPTQIIFRDTPGIFSNPRRRLERAMVHQAWAAIEGIDLVFLVVDSATKKRGEIDQILLRLKAQSCPVILILNKIDLVAKPDLLQRVQDFQDNFCFERIFLISAKTRDGLRDILVDLEKRLPKGPWLFPEDEVSDVPARVLAAEITREQVFHLLHDELPHNIYVETEVWETFRNGSLKIIQSIVVQKESQKAIVLGKQGQKVRRIGMQARRELADLFQRTVHLMLHVKVNPRWAEDQSFYKQYGLPFHV